MPGADLRRQIVEAARQNIGVKYGHQGYSNRYMDCRGVALKVGRTMNLLNREAEICNYGRGANPERLRALLARYLMPISLEDAGDGDIYLLRGDRQPQHIALRATVSAGPESYVTLIHADSVRGRVVEHRLDETWQARLVSAWRFPGVPA